MNKTKLKIIFKILGEIFIRFIFCLVVVTFLLSVLSSIESSVDRSTFLISGAGCAVLILEYIFYCFKGMFPKTKKGIE